MVVNKCDVSVGKSIYTPVLNESGGFRSDLTIVRLQENLFRIITGAFDGARDEHWFRSHLPANASVVLENKTNATCTFGVWGPKAVDLISMLTESELDQENFPYGTSQSLLLEGLPVDMLRISYVGDAGFEIYTGTQHGLALWDALWEAGQHYDLRPVGAAVYGTSGRLEKGYRLMGSELENDYNPVEAGLDRNKVKAADFIGKAAYLQARANKQVAQLCALTMDSNKSSAGYDRFPTGSGNEPILTLEGDRILDDKGRISRVTTAGNAPSLGKYVLLGYLPIEKCVPGTALQVLYQNELYPVTVAATGRNLSLYDSEDSRMHS
jgi:glycine cleavage system aminomethyltransferase T